MPNLSVTVHGEEPPRGPTLARVAGTDELGEIVHPGKNVGSSYCVGVHFPSTGEVRFFASDRVERIRQ